MMKRGGTEIQKSYGTNGVLHVHNTYKSNLMHAKQMIT